MQETRGQPDGLLVCHLPLGPTAYFTLSNVVMRHDIEDRGTVSEAYPHLIFDNFESPLGRRVADILKHVFPVPKDDARRVVTFANEDDRVRFRHHTFERAPAGKREVVLKVRGIRENVLSCVVLCGVVWCCVVIVCVLRCTIDLRLLRPMCDHNKNRRWAPDST